MERKRKLSSNLSQLLGEFGQFGAKLAVAGLNDESSASVWEFAAATAAEALVAGLARVKKCTMEGRGLMSLDFQQTLGGMRKLAPKEAKLDQHMRVVDVYIKAFYTPEEELLHWAQVHPEFTPAQLVALVNQIAEAFGWKAQKKKDFMGKLEATFV